MRLTVVGASGSVPGPTSPASCYVVETVREDAARVCIALDLGLGAFGPLQRYFDPLEINAVFITHTHADHMADLVALEVYLKNHPDTVRRLPVYGPFGLAGRVREVRGNDRDSGIFDFRVLQEGLPVRVGGLTVRSFNTVHGVPSYALRVTGPWEQSLCYSGDSAPCPGLLQAADEADVLLAEASFVVAEPTAQIFPVGPQQGSPVVRTPAAGASTWSQVIAAAEATADGRPGLHLSAAEVGMLATFSKSKRLFLTHIPPWQDPGRVLRQASSTFPGPIDFARSGRVIDVWGGGRRAAAD